MNIFKIDSTKKNLIITDFLISRLFLFIFLYLCCNFKLDKLWDCEHYINIATKGYTEDYLYAFFPLIPVLLRIIKPIGVIILNQILSIIIAFLFYEISNSYLKTKNPIITARLWLWSPIAVFTIIYYTEALFLFLTLFAFYLYKKNKYLPSGIILGLSVMCRNTGSLLFFTLFIFLFIKFIKKQEKFTNILKMYIPATIISCIYPVYLQIKTGNWKIFVDVQYDYWQKMHCNIFTIFKNISLITKSPKITQPLFYIDFILTMLLILITIILMIKNIKNKDYWEIIMFMAITIITITSTCKSAGNPVVSYYRYLFGTFPLILLLPQNKILLGFFKFISLFIAYFFLVGIYFY